jgi:hypothetical protein
MSPNSWFSQPVFLPGGDPEAMNEPLSNIKSGQLGIKFAYNIPSRSTPGVDSASLDTGDTGLPKGYKMVLTDSSMAVAPYDSAVAWWADQAAYKVTTSPTTLGRGRIAGVFRNTVTPGNVTCIQTNGKGAVKFIDAVVVGNVSAAGNFVIPSATAGKADVIAAGTAATYPTLGRTAGALQGGTSSAIVDLDVPDVF